MLSIQEKDLVRRAKAIYEKGLKEELERSQPNAFVAIEPDSGDYFLGTTLHDASEAALRAHPERRTYVVRVGHRAAIHMGTLL